VKQLNTLDDFNGNNDKSELKAPSLTLSVKPGSKANHFLCQIIHPETKVVFFSANKRFQSHGEAFDFLRAERAELLKKNKPEHKVKPLGPIAIHNHKNLNKTGSIAGQSTDGEE
jgi:hypothetical protein